MVFEIELIKQVEINVDYILMLVERYLKKKGAGEDKEIRATIDHAINAKVSRFNKSNSHAVKKQSERLCVTACWPWTSVPRS